MCLNKLFLSIIMSLFMAPLLLNVWDSPILSESDKAFIEKSKEDKILLKKPSITKQDSPANIKEL